MTRPTRLEDIHVIGADPGRTTGAARLHDGVLTTYALTTDQVDPVFRTWLAQDPLAVIGCEKFVVTRRTARLTAQPDAIRQTGVIHAAAASRPGVRVYDQNMSDAKKFGHVSLRGALGWHRTGPTAVHENDAVCQLLKVLYRAYPEAFHILVNPHVD